MLESLAEMGRFVLYGAALIMAIGAVSHLLGWLVLRQRTVRFVWRAWNVLGAVLLLAGAAAVGYGWLGLGLQTTGGSATTGLGLLLLSAGIWMLVPI